jgi:hypothetical protein
MIPIIGKIGPKEEHKTPEEEEIQEIREGAAIPQEAAV